MMSSESGYSPCRTESRIAVQSWVGEAWEGMRNHLLFAVERTGQPIEAYLEAQCAQAFCQVGEDKSSSGV